MNEPASQDEGTAGALRHWTGGLHGGDRQVAPANYPVKGQVNTQKEKNDRGEGFR